jgi:hypothetical protein
MYKSESYGKGGIYAKVVADSIANDVRLCTLELNYPRFIHSEFMTHRMFSRNASSSRAIPVAKMLEQVENNPAMPIHWGKNQPGMQAREECNNPVGYPWEDSDPKISWGYTAKCLSSFAMDWNNAGYHKQIVNRLTEPFQFIKVVCTATEWQNFFKLRLHPDSQPEIQELAKCMKEAMGESEPKELKYRQWHLPYINLDEFVWEHSGGNHIDWNEAIKASVARCARVSYLNHDNSNPDIEKDIALHDMLLEAGHWSPFEHSATPMQDLYTDLDVDWEPGVTHQDRLNQQWSGNFRGWAQYRQLLGNK